MSDRFTRRLASKLNLSEKQQARLLDLQSALDEARHRLTAWRNQQVRQFEALLSQEHFDRDQALATLAPSTAVLTEGASPVLEAVDQLHASLEPAQREKLLAMWRQRRCCH